MMNDLREASQQLLEAQLIARLGSYRFDAASSTWTGSEILDALFGIEHPHFHRDMDSWLQIVHPEDREKMRQYFVEAVLGQHKPFDRVYRIIRQNDHAERWVHGWGKLTLDDHGQVARVVGVIQDITERKQAEAALVESQSLYYSLVTQMPAGIFRKDAEGRYVLVNPAFCRLKGVTAEIFLGKTPAQVFTRLNYQATTCNSAREAIRLCSGNTARFDLLITDLTMPEINGLEVARQARALRPNLPVILASGSSAELNRENLAAAGICDLLEKPISFIALAESVRRAPAA